MHFYFVGMEHLYDLTILPRILHWQIFNTPEGMLSTEQGVYIAESVASNNMKQAKGRFKLYDNNESMVIFICLFIFISVLTSWAI